MTINQYVGEIIGSPSLLFSWMTMCSFVGLAVGLKMFK